VFCGRVYIFLFQSFPLGDRSSVNLRGHFHVENVTTFEEFLTTSTPVDDQMEIDSKDGVNEELQAVDSEAKPTVSEPTETEVKPTTMNIDTLYPVFWSLQHCFSDPPQLFEEKTFKQFREGLEATLAKFKEVPKVIQAMDSSRTTSAQELLDEDQDTYASASNPKYLTSRDLFKLEVSAMLITFVSLY
jgi:THO complex subunit 1